MNERKYHQLRCLGKIPYDTRIDANTAKAKIISRERIKIDIYHCKFCGKFHVTRVLELKKKKNKGPQA